MANITFDIPEKEIKELGRILNKYGARAKRETMKHLFKEATGIMTVSKASFVPVDTGALRSTGYVKPAQDFVELGYGGPAAPYALVVHEDLEAHHTVGSAKYLERPFRDATRGLARRLIARLRSTLR